MAPCKIILHVTECSWIVEQQRLTRVQRARAPELRAQHRANGADQQDAAHIAAQSKPMRLILHVGERSRIAEQKRLTQLRKAKEMRRIARKGLKEMDRIRREAANKMKKERETVKVKIDEEDIKIKTEEEGNIKKEEAEEDVMVKCEAPPAPVLVTRAQYEYLQSALGIQHMIAIGTVIRRV